METNSIRYWDSSPTAQIKGSKDVSLNSSNPPNSDTSFHASLLKRINSIPTSSLSSLGLGGGMFGDGGMNKLMDIDVVGIEKVWAEQLKSPLFNFNQTRTSESNSNGLGALGSSIELLMQAQMVKLNQQLELQEQSIGLPNAHEVGANTLSNISDNTLQLDQILGDIKSQLSDVSKRFDVPLAELLNRVSQEN